MPNNSIKGVVVPILTPLMPDGSQDLNSLRRLINYLLDNGVHGIWASGTTGEFANFTDKDRAVNIETVVDEINGRVPVIANISGPSAELTVRLGMEVREMGVAGVASTPPYYYPSGQDELMDHYRYIQDRLGAPLWVYNIPQTVKTAVAPATTAGLAEEGAVVGVKDSSLAGEALAELNVRCAQRGVDLYRFLGTVFRITTAQSLGTHGVIPGIANLLPAVAVKGWEAGVAGDQETARECDGVLLASGALQRVPQGGSVNSNNLASMKASLVILGVLDHDTMSRPMRELTAEEKEALPPILRELGLLN